MTTTVRVNALDAALPAADFRYSDAQLTEMYKRGEELCALIERSTGATRGRALQQLECVLRALDEMQGTRRLPRLPRTGSVYAATRAELAGYGTTRRPPRRPHPGASECGPDDGQVSP